MNERIKELKQQATFYANKEFAATGSHELWTDLFSEKFAELIVKECAMLVEGFILDQEVALDEYVEYEASEVLKEHFGVEE